MYGPVHYWKIYAPLKCNTVGCLDCLATQSNVVLTHAAWWCRIVTFHVHKIGFLSRVTPDNGRALASLTGFGSAPGSSIHSQFRPMKGDGLTGSTRDQPATLHRLVALALYSTCLHFRLDTGPSFPFMLAYSSAHMIRAEHTEVSPFTWVLPHTGLHLGAVGVDGVVAKVCLWSAGRGKRQLWRC